MSKIEAGEMMVAPRRTRLQPIIEDSVRSVEAVARDAGVTIVQSHNGVRRRAGRSRSHHPGAGEPAVERGEARAERITGRSDARREENSLAAVAVRDHGPGIPAHKVDFIFEPFTQLDGSDTRRIAGTGLGSDDRARARRETGWRHPRVVARRRRRDVHADAAARVTPDFRSCRLAKSFSERRRWCAICPGGSGRR